MFYTSQSLTWQWSSSCVDLHKDGLALQAVLHGVDADVVQLPGQEVAQSHGRGRVGERQLGAFAFQRWRVDDSVACAEEKVTRFIARKGTGRRRWMCTGSI